MYDRIKLSNKVFEKQASFNSLYVIFQIHKYVQMKDYCNHLTIIADWTDVNMSEYVKAVNISELRKACEIAFVSIYKS